MLWIAFRLYLWNTEHSSAEYENRMFAVVNCFQIVSLKYWAQLNFSSAPLSFSCELLSDCIFEILSTAFAQWYHSYFSLWIAFRLYLWNTEHSQRNIAMTWGQVVNCFQIVSLKYWAQHRLSVFLLHCSCELLSDCIFEILSTAKNHEKIAKTTLWIAFRLYLWNTEHSCSINVKYNSLVVNCFQIVSLKYWAQHVIIRIK